MPRQRCKRRERRQVDTASNRDLRPGASGPVEHPHRNLKPTVRIRPGQITAENIAIRFLSCYVNANLKTILWVRRVLHFPKTSFVGVSKPRYTISTGPTRAAP